MSGAWSWSPDGQRLAFAKREGATLALYTIAADGTDAQRVARIDDWRSWVPPGRTPDIMRAWVETVAWSPDGSKILYSCGGICVVTTDGAPVSAAPLPGVLAAWSPDGSRIATLSTEYAPLLRTMAPDGSDIRVLVLWHEADGPKALGLRPLEGPVDVAGCAAGTAVPQPDANPGLVHDCETLLVVQARLAGAENLGWTTDQPLTEWKGVVLGDSPLRVRRLALDGRGLRGGIPPELARLTHLSRLDLSQNSFGGVIPPELGTLSELRVLNLGRNFLGGAIPAELAGLTKLKELDLGWNYLTGTVPPELGNLTELRLLTLRDNQLTGCIPPGIGWGIVDRSYLGLPYCEAV